MLFKFNTSRSQYGFCVDYHGEGFFITDKKIIYWIKGIIPENPTDHFLEKAWIYALKIYSKS